MFHLLFRSDPPRNLREVTDEDHVSKADPLLISRPAVNISFPADCHASEPWWSRQLSCVNDIASSWILREALLVVHVDAACAGVTLHVDADELDTID